MDTITECLTTITAISEQLQQKRRRLDEIKAEIGALEQQGVYDAIPSESWESRSGGEKRYLRLVFPSAAEGRRKEYIGANPGRIIDAKEKVKRTRLLLGIEAEERRITNRAGRAKGILRDALKELNGKAVW